MKVGDGLGWPGHHLAHPAHPRYAPVQGQQQQEKVKPDFRRHSRPPQLRVAAPRESLQQDMWNTSPNCRHSPTVC